MADPKLKILLEASDHASANLKHVHNSVSGLSDASDRGARSAGLLGNAFSVAGGMLMAGGIIGGFSMLTGAIGGTIEAAKESQLIQAQLNAVLASTKGVSGMTAAAVNELADSLSKVTTFDDEAIGSAQNMLLTFTQIGKDVFPMATEAVLNMSQALGQDLQSSSIQLGKALQDPITGVTALRRVGVQLTDQQEKQIKTFVELGQVQEAQKVILGELTTEFGGAARAAGTTLTGKLAQLKTALGNVQEEIGGALLPVLTDLATAIMPFILSIIPSLRAGFDTIGRVLGTVGNAISFWVDLMRAKFDQAQSTISFWVDYFKGAFDKAANTIQYVQAFMASRIDMIIGALRSFMAALEPNLTGAVKNTFDFIITVMTPFVDFFKAHWNEIAAVVGAVWGIIEGTVRTAWALVEGIIKVGLAVLAGDWQGAWNSLGDMVGKAWDGIKQVFSRVWDLAGLILGLVPGLVGAALAAFGRIGEAIVGGIWAGIQAAWEDLKKLFGDLLSSLVPEGMSYIGAASPAKLFMPVGRAITEGVGEGIRRGAAGAKMALEDALAELQRMADAAAMALDLSRIANWGLGRTGTTAGASMGVGGGSSTTYFYPWNEAPDLRIPGAYPGQEIVTVQAPRISMVDTPSRSMASMSGKQADTMIALLAEIASKPVIDGPGFADAVSNRQASRSSSLSRMGA